MVDHVTEVSQWMVGVKRLIAETRRLSPELLKPLQAPLAPDQDSSEPRKAAGLGETTSISVSPVLEL